MGRDRTIGICEEFAYFIRRVMIENLKIKHLSYSSIQLWNECPRLWWLKYKYSISPAGISAFPFGTAIHESIQGALLTGGINTETVKQFRSRLESAIMRDNIQISNRERLELINTGEGILEDPTIQQLINTFIIIFGHIQIIHT